MRKTSHLHPSDIRALARLATDATLGIVDLVEDMHHHVLHPRRRARKMMDEMASGKTNEVASESAHRTRGIPGLIYRTVRGVARIVGNGTDAALGQIVPLFAERGSSPQREALLAACNGVFGDYMLASGNALAIRMQLRRNGQPLKLERDALGCAIPQAGGKIVVLLHGLCMNDLQWQRHGHNHGAALARDFGYTPLYLHYNSGLHISANGRSLAALLDTLLAQWPQPVEELVLVGHSMGGLVARSACHYAAQENRAWLAHLSKLVCLGTPHHGAPLERIGNTIETLMRGTPYVAPFARLGMLRSAGITDLRHGSLLDEDWEGRSRFAPAPDMGHAVPLPAGAQCYAIAATLGKQNGDAGNFLPGDGLVPLDSALGTHADPARAVPFPPSHLRVMAETGHLNLLSSQHVYAQMRDWFGAAAR